MMSAVSSRTGPTGMLKLLPLLRASFIALTDVKAVRSASKYSVMAVRAFLIALRSVWPLTEKVMKSKEPLDFSSCRTGQNQLPSQQTQPWSICHHCMFQRLAYAVWLDLSAPDAPACFSQLTACAQCACRSVHDVASAWPRSSVAKCIGCTYVHGLKLRPANVCCKPCPLCRYFEISAI